MTNVTNSLIVAGILSLFAVTVSVPAIGQSGAEQDGNDKQKSTSEQETSTTPAIQVGEASISKNEFNQRVDQRVKRRKMRQQMMKKRMKGKKGGGKTPKLPEVDREKVKERLKEQTIKQLVLEHHASKADITVTDAELDEEWQKIVDRFGSEEKLTSRLEKSGKDKSDLMNDLKKYLRIKKFVDQKADNSEVTDQEVREFYEKNKKRMGNKSFEKSKERIRKMLEQQQKRETRNELVEQLRKNTDVDVNI
jgi:hypothetical protein